MKPERRNVEQLNFEGSCYCGSCQFTCEGKPMFRVICHCSICTRISGGIAVAFVGFENDNLKVIKGSEHLRGFKSTERMERFHCEKCSSNVYNQSLLADRLFRDTPLMNFKRDDQENILQLDQLKPDSHMFFSQCQQCYSEMFKTDGLIKFSLMPGSTIIPNQPSK
ncbi:unnamed protein product [Rotaria sp. Silwood2]|nr:unnamed protein product [Rotaria sp. Silwood2]CAF3033861.1 unnamed protein product [Rotaria sp. Silwood2]CAF3298441.1 unnamed protein product [Rotaria sp. Silwood2]CAF3342996.1 unnamed protein product [Rotaria sp. Silwood2]CAF4153130.1 unnamed protein product [Rotaria sp. Silwood2]